MFSDEALSKGVFAIVVQFSWLVWSWHFFYTEPKGIWMGYVHNLNG